MANSDYTVRPNTHGFCPVGYLAADIGPLDTTVTMTGFTSPVTDGIRIGMAAMIGPAFSSGGDSDPHWSNVVFLLNTEGADNSTTFTDASPFAHTITTNGGAKITSNQLDADGNGDYLLTPKHAGFDLGSGDFCIEVIGYVRSNPGTGPRPLLAYWRNGTNELSWFFGINNSNSLVFYYSVDGTSGVFTAETSGLPTVGITPQHLMVNRIGGTLRLFVAGVKLYEATHSATIYAPATTPLTVAGVDYLSTSSHTDVLIGHRTARITKGNGRGYTSTFTPPTGPFQVSAQAFNQEIVVVTARTGNNLTLGRGCCDTVPAAHSTGDAIWFFDDSIGSDKLEYAGTETIGVKVLPRVTAGALPIEHAPPAKVEFNLRFARPYPPGLVEVNGSPWFTTPIALSSGTPTLALTWAHRDRITQQDQLIDHLQASIGPETGVTYEARVYRGDGTLLRAVTGLTGTSWSYALSDAVSDFSGAGGDYPGYIVLQSVRGGLYCLQDYRIDFTLQSSGVTVTEEALSLTVSIPVQPAGGSIAMAYTQAPVAASPGAAMVRFFTPSLLLAEPVPAGQTFVINFGQRTNNAGPIYYLVQYQTTAPTTRETIINSLKEQIDYLLVNSTTPPLSDYIELASVSDYNGYKWLHIVGQFGVEFMAEGTGVADPPGVTRPTVTGSNTSMISWANGAAIVPTSLPQIVTATVSGSPAAGDKFTITLNGTAFSRTSLTSESLSTVASALAALIDADPNFSASAAGAVITINGLTHTNVFTYSATSESMFAY